MKSGKAIRENDLDDFLIRLKLHNGMRFFGKPPDDGGPNTVFVPPDETRESDLPAYVPAAKRLSELTVAPSIRPLDPFLPFCEGKWIYHLNDRAYAYVSGAGSWVVTRPLSADERDIIPHYFMGMLDAGTRTPKTGSRKIVCRDVSSASNERSMIATTVPAEWPCSDAAPTLSLEVDTELELHPVAAWFSSLVYDFYFRMTSSRVKLYSLKARPAPVSHLLDRAKLLGDFATFDDAVRRSDVTGVRASIDAIMAELFELTPHEYAYVLSTFPLLDRDQPPLPHDYRIRATNKGIDRRRISFITRDLVLLTYFDYLAGRRDAKPDPERVRRICPDGVPEPPADLVAFFAEAGVDIGGGTEHAIAATGPFRDLRERVAKAKELGAVAYVPTIDRRRATFVERAAAAGGLSPDEGVLTPEMAARVLRDKADREARWERAMKLWDGIPDPHGREEGTET